MRLLSELIVPASSLYVSLFNVSVGIYEDVLYHWVDKYVRVLLAPSSGRWANSSVIMEQALLTQARLFK